MNHHERHERQECFDEKNFGEGQIKLRTVKLDFSKFSGDDLVKWVHKVDQFFAYHNTNSQHQILMVSFHMKGKVIPWFQELELLGGQTSWEAFVMGLHVQFGDSTYDDPLEMLMRLRQTTIVEAYKT